MKKAEVKKGKKKNNYFFAQIANFFTGLWFQPCSSF